MSSSGRFQSHLFNFVSRQAQKIADQTKKAASHLKIATIWGTQILLYPVYVLFQSTRLIGKQIGQAVQRSVVSFRLNEVIPQWSNSSPLTLPTVDTPIRQVLSAIQDSWPLAAANSSDLAKVELDPSLKSVAQPLVTIQGIASLISTGKLVLVAIDNQVMDVLTIEQQTHLKQRIIWEMASYWRYWRRHYIAQAHPTLLLPLEGRATLLPPVRVFRQLMAWVQSGPIAIAANLFQESALVQPATLDWFAADLTLSEFNLVILIADLPTAADLSKLIQQLPSPGEMESLVWAAIRYFFGEHPKSQLDTGTGEQTTAIAAANNLWLTSEEVFGKVGIRGPNPRSPLRGNPAAVQIEKTFTPLAHLSAQRNPKPLALPERAVTIGKSLQNWIKRSLPQPVSRPRSRSTLIHPKSSRRQITQPTRSQTLTPTRDRHQGAIAPVPASTDNLQKAARSIPSDYIDTHATPIGYIKSPLTRFLEWLDTGVVWLEKQLAALWNLLTRRF